jgi:4-aminobutyrate aminotransferase/4-aminobutyrate aminotransferase/(S)-3-amino-2-methylpropionate transaminase
VDAVTAQAGRLAVSAVHTTELARYLSALAAVLPDRLGRIALFSGGAESVEAAIRLAQSATGRPDVVTFSGSFHGKTAGVRYSADPLSEEARALGPPWLRTFPFPECALHDAVAYGGCEESADDVLTRIAGSDGLDRVGTVLVEPLLGTAGNLAPKRRFPAELRRMCDERGWLLVFDESITGFGRTGELFAFEHFGVEPDIAVLGKGLGGGFPLSAVCASGTLWEASSLRELSATGTSYGGNPLACAAGLATLEIVTAEEFLEQVRGVGAHAAARLRHLSEASARVARPRGAGLMLGFDLVDPATGDLASEESCAATFRACRDRGVLLAADVPRVRVSPPLTLSAAEADELFDVLLETLT